MEKRSRRGLTSFALAGLLALPLLSPLLTSLARGDSGLAPEFTRAPAVTAQNGMVVAQEALAARVGADILKKGGNAVDAAVAVGFAMAVTYPRAGNLGGGGFMIIHRAGGEETAIDYREAAAAGDQRQIVSRCAGQRRPAKIARFGARHRVPGTVAGLAFAEEKYGSGKFSLADLIAPAIKLARDGIVVADDTADTLPIERARLARLPATAQIFLKADGAVLAPGDRLVQTDLANTLEAVARGGRGRFTKATSRKSSPPGDTGRGRRHDPWTISKAIAPVERATSARHLSRLRHRLDAAAVLRRRGAH